MSYSMVTADTTSYFKQPRNMQYVTNEQTMKSGILEIIGDPVQVQYLGFFKVWFYFLCLNVSIEKPKFHRNHIYSVFCFYKFVEHL